LSQQEVHPRVGVAKLQHLIPILRVRGNIRQTKVSWQVVGVSGQRLGTGTVSFVSFLLRFQHLAQHDPGSRVFRPLLNRLAQVLLCLDYFTVSQGCTTILVLSLSFLRDLQIRNSHPRTKQSVERRKKTVIAFCDHRGHQLVVAALHQLVLVPGVVCRREIGGRWRRWRFRRRRCRRLRRRGRVSTSSLLSKCRRDA